MSATEQEIIESKALRKLQESGQVIIDLLTLAENYTAYLKGSRIKGHDALVSKAEVLLQDILDIVKRSEKEVSTITTVEERSADEPAAMFCKKCGTSLALHEMSVVCPN